MHKPTLPWKVLAPVVGGVLAATLYLIPQDGNETTASAPAPRSADTAPIEHVDTPPPPLTGSAPGTTLQPDQNISADSTDSAPARTNASAATQFDGDVAAPESPQQEEVPEDIMHQALSSGDPSARVEAINQLARINAPEAIDTLGHALQDGDADNRRAAVNSLRELGYNGGDPDGQIRNLLRTATEDPDPGIATWAGEIIEGLNGAFEQQ